MRWVKFTLASIVVVVAGVLAALEFGTSRVRELTKQVDELEQQKAQLVDFAQRLSASRRVAQIEVMRQRRDVDGSLVTSLWWQEIGPDGLLGKPQAPEVIGELVYFEALVIKFEHDFVGQGDELRGTSLVMFRRVFGEKQAPESVPELDRLAPPATAGVGWSRSYEDELWRRFWDFVDDPQLAAQYGVRVAQVEAPAVRLKPGQVWEASLDAAGGLNLRRIAQRELPQIVDTSSGANGMP